MTMNEQKGSTKFPLPPCRICEAPGAGFHYGVNTCEACKGFFHRSLTYSHRYTCANENSCVILHGMGKLCRLCRYKKCLEAGMSKSAIKTGRYNYKKRTEDILEVKNNLQKIDEAQVYQVPNIVQTVQNANPKDVCYQSHQRCSDRGAVTPEDGRAKPAGAVSDLDMLTNLYENLSSSIQDYPIPQVRCDEERNQLKEQTGLLNDDLELMLVDILVPPPIQRGLDELPTDKHTTTSPKQHHGGSLCNPEAVITPGEFWRDNDSVTSDSFSACIPSLGVHSLSPVPFQEWECDDNSKHNTNSQSNNLETKAPNSYVYYSDEATQAPCSQDSLLQSFPTGNHSELVDGHVDNNKGDRSEEDVNIYEIDQIFKDKDMIIQRLVEAHEKYVKPGFVELSDEEIKKQQKEHFESCRLRKEAFGGMSRLIDNEYDEIYTKTGIDADGRLLRTIEYSKAMESTIRAMVNFAKAIPGFQLISNMEKVNLIKYSRQEFCFLNVFKYVNPELGVYRCVSDKWQCSLEMENSEYRRILDNIFFFLSKFQHLGLTSDEWVVLRALIVMAPDRAVPTNSPIISAIYNQLVDLLLYQMGKHFDRPLLQFAKIMSLITECRTKEEQLTDMVKRQNLVRYFFLEDKPLLKAVFSGIYIPE